MKIGKKLSAVLAAGIISLSMAAPSFAMENRGAVINTPVTIYKNYLTGEKFSKAHAQECFETIGISNGKMVNADTKRVYVGHLEWDFLSGYISYMRIVGPDGSSDFDEMKNDKMFDAKGGKFKFKKGVYPYKATIKNTGTESKYFKGTVKIKVMHFNHGDKDLDIVPNNQGF